MTAVRQPAIPEIAADVLAGLGATPKRLPPKLFYDARGSELFEQITQLPEYYLTRSEREILTRYSAGIVATCRPGLTVIELGAGTAEKTAILLSAILDAQPRASFYPVDVSSSALNIGLARLNGNLRRLEVKPIIADYTRGIPAIARIRSPRMVVWLGSSIGNFEEQEAVAILRRVRSGLGAQDALLLGTDLEKSRAILLPAYDDPQGVTAAFNKNVLARINRELGGEFDLQTFDHVAVWNPAAGRMEMYLESWRRQQVRVAALGRSFEFRAGERIHTENSYKYTAATVDRILHAAGFSRSYTWTDTRKFFALHLACPA